jgi:CARDB
MSSYDRRAEARRRAWGRGPMILRFEPLEGRQLLTTAAPNLVAIQFSTVHNAGWGAQIDATGTIANRGNAPTTRPAEVDIYASTTPTLTGPGAKTQFLGSIDVPPDLKAGKTYPFSVLVTLPQEPTSATAASQQIFVTLNVDPSNAVHESTMTNKSGRGNGLDTSTVNVIQNMPANLVGTTFSIAQLTASTPGVISWGDSINVTEQIKNNGAGNAPPTRARIVLTPLGATPGGYSDVTIGNIAVPAIPAFQSTNVVQQVTLPPIEPLTLGSASQFTISVVQDADFLTQPVYPRIADQGRGLDQGPIGISPGPEANTPQGPTPDLAPSAVMASQNSLYWGQSFQVSAVVQNISNVDAGPFTVRFVATGSSGDVTHGIFLGDVQVPSLAANAPTTVVTTVQLPSKLPYGDSVASPAYAEIYAIADPEDVVNESLRGNNMSSSAPILLQVVGTDGTTTTVPTYPQNVYANPALAAQAAKQVAQTQKAKLGTPKPAASAKKHKVNLLASISETIVNQIEGIPKGVTSLLKNIGGTGGSGTSSSPTTTTTTTTANTNAAGNSGGTGGFGATPISNSSAF